MKRKRLLIVLALALVTGSVAGYLALSYLAARTRPLVAQSNKGQVAVAARDLPVGSILRTEDIRVIDWPGDAVPAGYATSSAEIVGRGVITPLKTNEPVLASNLADKEAGGGLPIVIPEGMRGLSVKVDEVIGVAGFVLPNTRVDVLLTMTLPGQNADAITRILLQNVEVLTAGQTIQRDAEGKPITVNVVTLLVTPAQAETLALAAGRGEIQLALRNGLDMDTVRTSGVRQANLLGGVPATRSQVVRAVTVAPTRRAPARSTGSNTGNGNVVETYRGGVRTLSTFQQRANDTIR